MATSCNRPTHPRWPRTPSLSRRPQRLPWQCTRCRRSWRRPASPSSSWGASPCVSLPHACFRIVFSSTSNPSFPCQILCVGHLMQSADVCTSLGLTHGLTSSCRLVYLLCTSQGYVHHLSWKSPPADFSFMGGMLFAALWCATPPPILRSPFPLPSCPPCSATKEMTWRWIRQGRSSL